MTEPDNSLPSLLPAQVCLLDALLRERGSAPCPTCLVEARPVMDTSRIRIDPLRGIRVAFPCGHAFAASDAILEEANRALTEASAMYYGWDRPDGGKS